MADMEKFYDDLIIINLYTLCSVPAKIRMLTTPYPIIGFQNSTSNFVSHNLKLHIQYCHNDNYKVIQTWKGGMR